MDENLTVLIAEILRELEAEGGIKLPAAITKETSLIGQEAILDSLGLVSLVVALEQAIEDKYAVSVSLADEKALSQKNSPYQTVGSLARYAGGLIEQAGVYG